GDRRCVSSRLATYGSFAPLKTADPPPSRSAVAAPRQAEPHSRDGSAAPPTSRRFGRRSCPRRAPRPCSRRRSERRVLLRPCGKRWAWAYTRECYLCGTAPRRNDRVPHFRAESDYRALAENWSRWPYENPQPATAAILPRHRGGLASSSCRAPG